MADDPAGAGGHGIRFLSVGGLAVGLSLHGRGAVVMVMGHSFGTTGRATYFPARALIVTFVLDELGQDRLGRASGGIIFTT